MSISTYSEVLRDSRRAARRFGVDVKGITTSRGVNPPPLSWEQQWYEVWQHGQIVWQNPAWDAIEAKHRAIEAMIQRKLRNGTRGCTIRAGTA